MGRPRDTCPLATGPVWAGAPRTRVYLAGRRSRGNGKRKVGARVHTCVKKTCVRRVPQGAGERAPQEAAAPETPPPPPKGLARLLSGLSPSTSSAQLWPWRLRARHPSRLARNGLSLRQHRRRCRASRTWSLVARALRSVTPGGARQSHQPAARKLRRCSLAAAVFSISARLITRDNGRCQTDSLLLVVPCSADAGLLRSVVFNRDMKSIPLLFLSVGRIIRRIKIARFWMTAFGNRVQKRELNRSDARGM